MNKNTEDHTKVKKEMSFTIVGIGSSAGGLEALEVFFENMPATSGMAFVIIQHQEPSHSGLLPELLQKLTKMKVHRASDGLKIKANNVYVIPPNKNMSVLNDTLFLFDPIKTRGIRLPIDLFFRSLAIDHQEKCVGVILSGMGSDGSIGIKTIKENNGFVAIQDPKNAKFNSMPKSAIESVEPDIIAPVAELPEKIIDFVLHQKTKKSELKNNNNLEKIIVLLRNQTGNDFSMYKKNTLYRRIERRKNIHQIDTISNYIRFLQENPHEIELLFKELLIGVTTFFRDTPVWEKLKEVVLPELISKFPEGYTMRAWIAGCSTGEEAYSFAITFKEVIESVFPNKKCTLQLFATDLDNDAIDKARKGYFSENNIIDITPERLKRFFTKDSQGYRISNSIRELIVFAPQNVIKDPPFTKLDFISCRNMLIYMEPELQRKLIPLFNYSLNPGGILVLGSSETLGNHNNGFEEVDSKLKIYKRNTTFINKELIDFPSIYYHTNIMSTEKKIETKTVDNIQSIADKILLQQYAPASVVVNEKGDIIYITGRTGKYLEPVAGKANWNIHSMAREGLNHELLGAFRKATQNYDPITIPNIKIGEGSLASYINLTVQRLKEPEAVKNMVLIVFNDSPSPSIIEKEIGKNNNKSTSELQKSLEIELRRCQQEMQRIQEEMQTSEEELKSTNEELQSTNEELQSTNEELTTSKEEMQSLNEELQTVNVELQRKVTDYIRANDDMKNLLNSIEVATLFLDKELNIRRYTDQVTQIFKLRTADIGRPFTDLVSDLCYPEIATDANQVIKSLIYIQKATVTTDGRWYNVRIMPYRTVDDRIDGLVITFTDITAFKNLESELKLSEERFRISLENTPISVFNQDNELRYTWIHNPFINRSIEDIIGKKDEDFLTNESVTQLNEIKTAVLKSGKSQNKEIQLAVHGIKNTYKLMVSPLKNSEGTIIGITGITWDINKLGS